MNPGSNQPRYFLNQIVQLNFTLNKMAQNFIYGGDVLDYPATGAITSGVPFLMGTKLVVPMRSGISGDIIPVRPVGVFNMPKTTGEAWTIGAALYWNDTTKKLTTTVGSNTLQGYAAAAAIAGATEGAAKITG